MNAGTFPVESASVEPVATGPGPLWARIRHDLVDLSFAVQEVALLTPLALVLMSWARFWPPVLVALWLLLLMLVPFNLLRLMSALQWDRTRQRRVMITMMVLAVFLSWRTLLYSPTSVFDLSWLGQFAANLAEGGNLV
ncbi:MAG: hypothetical protein R3C44_09175 [Chloroflexota bacterium]